MENGEKLAIYFKYDIIIWLKKTESGYELKWFPTIFSLEKDALDFMDTFHCFAACQDGILDKESSKRLMLKLHVEAIKTKINAGI